jgi:hypothetical protein
MYCRLVEGWLADIFKDVEAAAFAVDGVDQAVFIDDGVIDGDGVRGVIGWRWGNVLADFFDAWRGAWRSWPGSVVEGERNILQFPRGLQAAEIRKSSTISQLKSGPPFLLGPLPPTHFPKVCSASRPAVAMGVGSPSPVSQDG